MDLATRRGSKDGHIPTEKYYVVLVGPPHLKNVPFLNPAQYIDSSGVNRKMDKTSKIIDDCAKLMDQQKLGEEGRPLLFLLAAGFSSKIIIAELLQYKEESSNNHTQSFIDVGASLDGYVGVKSRDYNHPKRYCEEVIKNDDPKNRYHWMKKGVCEEKYWKDYNFTSSFD